MNPVLVLNLTYEPLNVVSVRRAVWLLLARKAQAVENGDGVMRSQYLTVPVPLVIRLVYYVQVPRGQVLGLSRRAVLARDGYTCQYCGQKLPAAALTVDHVLPRCRGGRTEWENVVTACGPCNRRKGDRTPAEAGMDLLRRPRRPHYAVRALLEPTRPQVWAAYLR